MPSLRIGDLERDQAADSLSDHFAAGRLDRSEFDERLAAAYSAKHSAELTPLFADLPGAAVRPVTAVRTRTGPGPMPLLAVLAVVLLVGSSVAAVAHGYPPVLLFVALWVWRGRRHRYGYGVRHHG